MIPGSTGIDHSGEVFGCITVVKRSMNRTKTKPEYLWICQCECGNTLEERYTHLKNGNTKTCGDYENHKRNNAIKLNEIYGGFKVIQELDRIKFKKDIKYRYYECACIYCGTKQNITYNVLMTCPPPDCGCLRVTPQETITKIELKFDIKLIGDLKPPSISTTWKCNKHELMFERSASILLKAKTCPCLNCIEERRELSCIKEARNAGIDWLGPVVIFGQKTKWRCKEGHIWESALGDIRKGNRCPICSGRFYFNGVLTSRIQIKLAELLETDEKYINYRIGKYAIDIADPDRRIAVEYDGIVWHDEEDKEETRNKYLLKQGWKTIRFKSDRGDILPTQEQIDKAFEDIQIQDLVVVYL